MVVSHITRNMQINKIIRNLKKIRGLTIWKREVWNIRSSREPWVVFSHHNRTTNEIKVLKKTPFEEDDIRKCGESGVIEKKKVQGKGV